MKRIVSLIIILITVNVFSQSPWTKKKGEFYTQLSFSTIANYKVLYGSPDYNTERETTDNTFQFYGEYGLSNKTTLILNLPLKFIKTNELVSLAAIPSLTSKGEESAFGNIEIGIKHNFYNKDWLISGQINLEANTSTFNINSGIRTGYDAWSVTPLLSFGRGFNNWYVQGFTGVNIRTNNYSSNFKIGGEIGYKPISKLWLIAGLDILKSFDNGDVILPTSNLLTGLYINNQEYSSFSIKAIGEITKNFGLTAGIGGAFSGNNVAKQGAFNFGIYHKF